MASVKNRKFWITIFMMLGFFGISAALIVYKVWDINLWIALLGAMVGVATKYDVANVAQKKVISKDYHQELDK